MLFGQFLVDERARGCFLAKKTRWKACCDVGDVDGHPTKEGGERGKGRIYRRRNYLVNGAFVLLTSAECVVNKKCVYPALLLFWILIRFVLLPGVGSACISFDGLYFLSKPCHIVRHCLFCDYQMKRGRYA